MGWSSLLGASTNEPRAISIRAYSELMPPPYVGVKPYGERDPFTPAGEHGFAIGEIEERLELAPGLAKIAHRVLGELADLTRGAPTQLSKTLLRDNPCWTPELAKSGAAMSPLVCCLPLALSKTQDDKGRVLWTLFGASHEGAERPFWQSFRDAPGREIDGAEDLFRRFIAWASERDLGTDLRAQGVRVLSSPNDLPSFAQRLLLDASEPLDPIETLLTFVPFAHLPAGVRERALSGALRLVPSPVSQLFFWHAGYRRLAEELPGAAQIPLLHLFPRTRGGYGIRIPQSGWLDELPDGDRTRADGHRVSKRVPRTHRWQRVERDQDDAGPTLDDPVTVALFSTRADDLGLYGKPMARNAQIWTEDYRALLDGPSATEADLASAAAKVTAGRFGYRFFYPPMRAAGRSIYWHRPLVAKLSRDPTAAADLFDGPLHGFMRAEGEEPIDLWPRLLDRRPHQDAIELYERGRKTTTNVKKLLDFQRLLERPLPPSFARRLINAPKDTSVDEWLKDLAERASDRDRGAALAEHLRSQLGPEPPPGDPLTIDKTLTRDFEERYWRTIAALAEGDLHEKNNADLILVNEGRSGGPAAKSRTRAPSRQLDPLADHLHKTYADLIERHGMTGRAYSADHLFRWQTDFRFEWSEAWSKNQRGESLERNIFVVIPGRSRSEAVIMADHYDTAYMEDLYEPGRGGDRLRAAAAGADDNHSATAALMLAADILLPLSRAGALERDVWLVHLTGEEFPADCLGARALAERLLARDLALEASTGPIDLSSTRVTGAFVLDMIAHNNDKNRDVFQIAPGEGRGSAELAHAVHLANERWNAAAKRANRSPDRSNRQRSARMPNGGTPPPIAPHLRLFGEVRPEWDPRSSLYNTDAQIFSDVGVPVVLLMENYDISRSGYHDMHDTMENIDLDYGAALAAIAIEAVAISASTG